MKLFLASEAKHPESMARLESFINGFAGKKISYIPTAANGQGRGNWKEGGSWNLIQTLRAEINLIELEEYFSGEDVASLIKGSDIVWFAGGMSGYLLYWIRRTKLDTQLSEILNGGTVYVGSSSGSMIASRNQELSEWYIGEKEPGAAVIPGLGLVDFEIYPHYEDHLYDQIKKLYAGKKLYLLKNGEAITVVDDKVSVLGEERIIVN